MATSWERASAALHRLARRPATGEDALIALADVGTVRRALDQVELEAVRAARRDRRSWAEIATRLGITRQSAWERWRDIDEEPSSLESVGEMMDALTDVVILDETDDERVVTVPKVVGLSWAGAQRRLLEFRLHAVSSDPHLTALVGPDALDVVVLDQKPGAGEQVPSHSPVTLWLRRGPGSAGIRAQLPPPPHPLAERGMVDEETGRSVSR